MKRIFFISICCVAFLTGCMAPKTSYLVTSDPAGAAIYLDGEPIGKTPAKIKVEFPETGQGVTEKKILQLRMTGYKEQKEVLSDCGPVEKTLNFSLELEAAPQPEPVPAPVPAPKPATAVVSAPSVTPVTENKTTPDVISTPVSTQAAPEAK